MACVVGAEIGLIVAVVIFASSLWVANDSEKYDWSLWSDPKHPEWNSAAESFGTWVFACLLLWPVFFPGTFGTVVSRRAIHRRTARPPKGAPGTNPVAAR